MPGYKGLFEKVIATDITDGLRFLSGAPVGTIWTGVDNQDNYPSIALIVNSSGVSASWYYNSTSTATDDGDNVIQPNSIVNSEPGRWIKM